MGLELGGKGGHGRPGLKSAGGKRRSPAAFSGGKELALVVGKVGGEQRWVLFWEKGEGENQWCREGRSRRSVLQR